jgi:hypothetical protein
MEPEVKVTQDALAGGVARTSTESTPFSGSGQKVQDSADGLVPAGELGEGQMALDHIAVPTTFLALLEVAGVGQLGDDGVGPALGNGQGHGDIAQADLGVTGDAEQGACVIGEERPILHVPDNSANVV